VGRGASPLVTSASSVGRGEPLGGGAAPPALTACCALDFWLIPTRVSGEGEGVALTDSCLPSVERGGFLGGMRPLFLLIDRAPGRRSRRGSPKDNPAAVDGDELIAYAEAHGIDWRTRPEQPELDGPAGDSIPPAASSEGCHGLPRPSRTRAAKRSVGLSTKPAGWGGSREGGIPREREHTR
jgi:hypothetical protein